MLALLYAINYCNFDNYDVKYKNQNIKREGKMRRGRVIILLSVVFIIIFQVSVVCAEYLDYNFKEIGVFSGFLKGKLSEKGHYEALPVMLRFGFDLRPLFKKDKCRNLMEFVVEPFANTVISPDNNAELGCNFLLKLAPAIKDRFYPYFEGGLGMVYLTQHTREQSTQFNFSEQVGAGITFMLKKNLAISAGYRRRHVSNASIKRPNKGIDSDSFICGVSLFY